MLITAFPAATDTEKNGHSPAPLPRPEAPPLPNDTLSRPRIPKDASTPVTLTEVRMEMDQLKAYCDALQGKIRYLEGELRDLKRQIHAREAASAATPVATTAQLQAVAPESNATLSDSNVSPSNGKKSEYAEEAVLKDVLFELSENTPMTPQRLSVRIGAPQTLIYRALVQGELRSWVVRDGQKFTLTPLGKKHAKSSQAKAG
jgi:hypothetical protein